METHLPPEKHPPPTSCSYPLTTVPLHLHPLQPEAPQLREDGGRGVLPAKPKAAPLPALGTTTHLRVGRGRHLCTQPGSTVSFGGGDSLTANSTHQLQMDRMSPGTAPDEHLPTHPGSSGKCIPKSSNKSGDPSSGSACFSTTAGCRHFKPSLTVCPWEIWAPFLCQRTHQNRFCLQKINKTIPHRCQ